MPFLPQNNYDDEAQKKNPQGDLPGASTQGTSVSGANGTFSVAGAGQSGAAPASPTRSGSFANLNEYLDANKEQANQIGDQASSKITTAGDDARNAIAGSNAGFNSAVNSGTIANLGTASDEAKATADQAKSMNSTQTLGSDQLNRFGAITNATYRGPKQLADTEFYQPAYDNTQKVTGYAKEAGSEQGREQLVRDLYTTPTYSQGQNTFDNLLLGGSQTAQAKLQNARANVNDVQGVFDNSLASTSTFAKNVADQTAKVKADSRAYTDAAQTNQNAAVKASLDNVQGQWTNQYDALTKALDGSNGGKNLSLTDDQMKALGVTPDERIYNLLQGNKASQFLSQNAFDANKEVSKDQQAQLSALDQLTAQYGGSQLNKYVDPSLAGTQTLADAVDGSRFGAAATNEANLFNDRAKTTAVNASARANSLGDDQFWSQANITNLLSNALAGQNGNLSMSYGAVHGSQGDVQAAQAQAQANYFAELNRILDEQGFNNTIKKS
jgi:hypothetical protein